METAAARARYSVSRILQAGLIFAVLSLITLPVAAQCGVPAEILSLTASPIDANGTFVLTIQIRNVQSYYITWRGNSDYEYAPFSTAQYQLSALCMTAPSDVVVDAINCICPGCTQGHDHKSITISPMDVEKTAPVVSAKKTGMTSALVHVEYKFPGGATNKLLTLNVLEWTDAQGRTFAGQNGVAAWTTDGPHEATVTLPDGARHGVVEAVATSCYGTERGVGSFECGCGFGDPISPDDGNMRLHDSDPLPPLLGRILSRAYDSGNQLNGFFGRGWTSILDRQMHRDVTTAREIVTMATDADEMIAFVKEGSSTYRQLWPKGKVPGTFSYDAASGLYVHREPNAAIVSLFNADGSFHGYREIDSGHELTITRTRDAQGVLIEAAISDSWTGVTWRLALSGNLVQSIAVDGQSQIAWTYEYSGGLLTRVAAPGDKTWRTYTYLNNLLTESRDALGNTIESHTYDSQQRATSSHGPAGEISSIQYDLPGPETDQLITRVTNASGGITDFVIAPAGGTYRTVRHVGGCASCGRDSVTSFDRNGYAQRHQDASGYITESSYDLGRLVRSQSALRPTTCDPETDINRCHFTTVAALAGAILQTTPASLVTTYVHGDSFWPDKPTEIAVTSVLTPSSTRRESFAYDVATGSVLSRATTGWTGQPAVESTRTTQKAYYNGSESAAFTVGGSFSSAWQSLAQPAGVLKSIDGPRSDVNDVTRYVYYPDDTTVPPLNRRKLAAISNAAGQITHLENYDVFGNAAKITDANGVVTEMTYDPLGRLLTTSLDGVAGCNTVADPLCATTITTTKSYYDAGPLHTEQPPAGGVTEYTYDARGRVDTQSRGPSLSDLREQIQYSYDPSSGRKSLEIYRAMEGASWVEKRRESFAYDNQEQLVTVTHADGTSAGYSYRSDGLISGVRDENHATVNTQYSYDPAGRLTVVTQTLGQGSVTTSYAYDLQGNLNAVTDPNGNQTQYLYDDFGALLSQNSPATGTTTYAYDAAGNLTSTTDGNGAATVRTYDSLGRVLTAVATREMASESVTWTYDGTAANGIGRLASMSDPAGSTAYTYDRRGLLLSESRSISPVLLATSYQYDANGNRTVVYYPSGVVTYTHDYAGRPLTLSSGVTYVSGASYLPFGPMTSLSFANGTTQTRTYDARYRIQRNTLTGSSGTIADYSYTEDAAGNITSILDMRDPSYNRGTLVYDDLNRLTAVDSGASLWGDRSTGRGITYKYDAMGNLLARDLGGMIELDPNDPNNPQSRRFAARPDALPAPGSIHETYSYIVPDSSSTARLSTVTSGGIDHPIKYDGAGNETQYYDTRTYSPRNLMSSITEPSEDGQTHTINYSYDGRGVRLIRSEGTTGTGTPYANRYYVYSPELQLLSVSEDDNFNVWGKTAVKNSVPSMKHVYAWFNGQPVLHALAGNTLRYIFTDHLGTPILETDGSASVVWWAEYEPYGDIWTMHPDHDGNPIGSPRDQLLRFPGQEYAGKWEGVEERYNIFRWYRSGWGRYTQADPISIDGGLNLYEYATENPLLYQDSLGLKATPLPRPPVPRQVPEICPKAKPGAPGPPWLAPLLIAVTIFFDASPLNQDELKRPEYCGSCDDPNDKVERCKKACVKAYEIRYDECSERYSGNKNKQRLCYERIAEMLEDCLKGCDGKP